MELAALHCIPEIKTVFSGEILQTAKDLFFNKTKKQKKKKRNPQLIKRRESTQEPSKFPACDF
ncbi:hypothetical protein EWD33_19490 [Salmonella enterica subsp. enterica serovar Oranienburg]|nr:hypothetical protein [Salmonella enterica subsp. enterica serovar Oranienburg]